VNNTRDEPMKDEGPDRHCLRPTRKGVMKCSACHDYNKGVRRGECFACGHKRFDVANLLSVLDGAELEKEVLTLSFEESIERRRWSEEEMSAAGVNTNAVLHCVRAVFANKALVHKEGSTRKDTAVDTSDIDLMVTLSNRRAMNDAQRDDLLRALRARVDVFRDVRLGRHAIKIQPHQGPSIDVVAHHSSFELSPTTLKYLAPAGTGFWGKPAVALAVSGIKIWWSAIKDGIELNVSVVAGQTPGSKSPPARIPGHVWESIVLSLEEALQAQATGDQAAGTVKSGLDYFLQTMEHLASDDSGSSTTWRHPLGGPSVAADWRPIRQASRMALATWQDSHDLRAAFSI